MRHVDINVQDMSLIQASVVGCVRRLQMSTAPEKDKISFTTAAAEALSRLNHGEIDDTDVRFINTCIQRTLQLVRVDPKVPQRDFVLQQLEQVQNKLRGPHGTLLDIWDDGERQDHARETVG